MIINHFQSTSKNKQEPYEKLIEISKNEDYTTGYLLDSLHRKNVYKRIGIDLSRQTNTNILQQNIFRAKLEEDDGAAKFLISKKQKKLF